ncbi:MAG: ferrous iron transport protein A [Saprospiraceae bacterium]|nr:ferrous iron transport protein A [Saprospiraceae bacterium]
MKQQTMSQIQTLSNLKVGSCGKIRQFTDDQMASKMMSMGILPGKVLKLIRRAPFGGGLYLKVEDNNIAVREVEAQNILIEVL